MCLPENIGGLHVSSLDKKLVTAAVLCSLQPGQGMKVCQAVLLLDLSSVSPLVSLNYMSLDAHCCQQQHERLKQWHPMHSHLPLKRRDALDQCFCSDSAYVQTGLLEDSSVVTVHT